MLRNYVIDIINKKKNSKEEYENYIQKKEYSFKDLEDAFDFVMMTKKVTSKQEQCYCFLSLYNLFKEKKQFPKYTDPKNGMASKKINDINLFIEQNKNSVYAFVSELEQYIKENV